MRNSKLITTLMQLSPTEIKQFQAFIHADYFNKHEGIKRLTDILADHYPTFDNDALSKEQLFKSLFPGEKMKTQKVSDLGTYTFRLLMQFLAQQVYEQQAQQQTQNLLRGLREHELDRLFEKEMNKALSVDNTTKQLFTDEVFQQHFMLETENNLYFTAKDSRTADKSIERMSRNLDVFYLTAKLRQACEMINRQNIIQQQYNIRFLDEVEQMVDQYSEITLQAPAIAIYRCILKTLTEPQEHSHYHKLIELLNTHNTELSHTEARSMYDFAQNYCIKQINIGNREFLKEIFELYKTLLDTQILFQNNQLSQWDYKNIVTVGTRLQEFSWTEDFLHSYKEHLPEADRDNAYNYNLANFYYSCQRYDEALELLRNVRFTDIYYSLGARSLLLKVYYEAEEFDPLYSLIDSFKIYLKRNKTISEYQHMAHMNLVRLTKKITDLHLRLNVSSQERLKRDLDKIKHSMSTYHEVTNAAWVTQQIEKLEKQIVQDVVENP